jgi:arginyl-tRNA synthetase
MFPEVFLEAVNNLKPSIIAEYANSLADKFNSFYSSVPVIQAESRNLRDARMELVSAVGTVLRNALLMLGIEAPERM